MGGGDGESGLGLEGAVGSFMRLMTLLESCRKKGKRKVLKETKEFYLWTFKRTWSIASLFIIMIIYN